MASINSSYLKRSSSTFTYVFIICMFCFVVYLNVMFFLSVLLYGIVSVFLCFFVEFLCDVGFNGVAFASVVGVFGTYSKYRFLLISVILYVFCRFSVVCILVNLLLMIIMCFFVLCVVSVCVVARVATSASVASAVKKIFVVFFDVIVVMFV